MTRNLAADYRRKAEEARAIAETMGDKGARPIVLEVAATWDRLADDERKSILSRADPVRAADGCSQKWS